MYDYKKGKKRTFGLFIAVLLFSCNTEDMLPEVQENLSNTMEELNTFQIEEIEEKEMSFRLGNWNMIYEETFEGVTPFYCCITKQFGTSYSFRPSTSQALKGNKSGRFELRQSDPQATENGKRSEILFPRPAHKERWYSFGIYLPSSGFAKDSNNDVLSQWHQGGGKSPPLSFRIMNDRFLFRMINESGEIKNNYFENVVKNTWHQFVFHIIHSYNSDGLIEIWQSGKKIFTKTGRNMYNLELPNWKLGIYKPTWEKATTDTDLRVLFFDNIRMGNENTKYEEMVPSSDNLLGWGSYIPNIQSFTLINASQQKEIRKISNNETINTREFGTNRISLKAAIESGFGGSLKFDLIGPKKVSIIDNFAPFALFGNDGNGNYYNGGGLELGNYSLTVTPYDEGNARGKEGQPYIINFKVVDEPFVSSDVPSITGFSLIKANIDAVFGPIKNGDIVSLENTGTDKLSIRANLPTDFKGEVNFKLSGQVNRVSTATSAPYTIYNYSNGDYSFGSIGLPIGTYNLEATPVYQIDGVVKFGVTSKISFQVVSAQGTDVQGSISSTVQSFTLIRANADTVWGTIQDGTLFSASQLGTHKLTVRVEMPDNFVGRVQFNLSGTVNRSSSSKSKPYVLNNYDNGNYSFGDGLPVGAYTLSAIPYTINSLNQEVKGNSKTIRFTIK